MTQSFRCGDYPALVGYLYDECKPAERDAIAAHVLSCRPCAAELETLAGTREQLSAWTPPDALLGFRISSETLSLAADEGVRSLTGARPVGIATGTRSGWWRQPLPAWAQLAAAALIFASGLTVGTLRGSVAPGQDAARAPGATPDPAVVALKNTVASLERRLAGVEQEGGVRTAVVRVNTAEDIVTLPSLQHTLAESERRTQQEMAAPMWQLASYLTSQQRDQNEKLEANTERVAALENYVLLDLAQR